MRESGECDLGSSPKIQLGHLHPTLQCLRSTPTSTPSFQLPEMAVVLVFLSSMWETWPDLSLASSSHCEHFWREAVGKSSLSAPPFSKYFFLTLRENKDCNDFKPTLVAH